MPYKDKSKRAEAQKRYRKRKQMLANSACKVSISDMENTIQWMESQGYTDVKVTDCPYWQTKGKGFKEAKSE